MKFTKRLTSFGVAGALALGVGAAELATMSDAVAAATTTMTVKPGITLNVRTGPGTSYATKGSLAGGAVVTGASQGNGWFQLASGPYSGGFVSLAYLTGSTGALTPPSTTTPPPAADSGTAFRGYIVQSPVQTLAHSGPSTESSVVRYLNSGVPIQGQLVGDWLKTTQGDYVSRGLITTTPLHNGALLASRLCGVPVAWNTPTNVSPNYTRNSVRPLDCYALKSLTGLENAYHAQFGHYALIDLGYRSYAEQVYWYHQFGYPRAAIPGTSNHGLGLAVDFRETDARGEEFGWGGTGFTWLKNNGWKWGYRNPFKYGTDGESYHWNFEGGALLN